MSSQPARSLPLAQRAVIGLLVFLLLLLLGLQTARAGEVLPSIGMSRTPGSSESPKFYGIALRGPMSPRMESELAVSWHRETVSDGDMTVKSVPITFSIWATPVRSLYLGGGAGYYYDEVSYRGSLGIPSASDKQFAYHLGGGLNTPMSPRMSLDLQGRYIFRKEKQVGISGGTYDPTMWTAAVGIAFKY
jgi:hypothetical protein